MIDKSRLEKIWQNALNQDDQGKTAAALKKISKNEAFAIMGAAIERMAIFENAADVDELNGVKMDRKTAERIGSIWIFSGVGTYDRKSLEIDNPMLAKDFLKGSNRRRVDHGIRVACAIAQARSGKELISKELIAEFGPYIVFGSYDELNEDAENVFSRKDILIPKEKVFIARKKDSIPMKTTTDQVRYFESPQEVRDREVAFVSDGTHLNRILHIAGKFHENLPSGKPVNLFPSPLPKFGREEFANMETQGLLAYIYRDNVASKEPYPYSLER